MTTARLPHTPARPTLTGGDDRPATPCEGRWWLFDTIIDAPGSALGLSAVKEARDLCGTCPISRQCLTVDNAGQEWAQLIVGARNTRTKACGTVAAYRRHLRDKTPTCAPCREAWRTRFGVAA